MLDYVQEKVVEPPSKAPIAAKKKYRKSEVKAKKILVDSIQKHLISCISDLGTSKEMYDKLIGMFCGNFTVEILLQQLELILLIVN